MKDIHAFEPIWESWVIDEELGRGSYGTVWKAHREDRFSHVRQYAAVKHISIPKQDGPGDDDIIFPSDEERGKYYSGMLDRLIVEIDAMISLRGKPNIVFYEEHKVVPKGQNQGYDLFLRMELLQSIPSYLSKSGKRCFTPEEVVRLGIDLATALETLESHNFVHRDIKPDNIFIDEDGHFKLGDFGTARVLEAAGNASTVTGTMNYMAPEVYAGSGYYDQTVDIYSLGIVLYRYMNNGYLPFMAEPEMSGNMALSRRIRGEEIKAPCNADEELSAIVLKACAFRPEDRYQNATDLKRDLLKYLEKTVREVEIPVICQTDDGREIYRGAKKAKAGSRVRIGIEDIPYDRFVSEDMELVSDREIVVTVDASGKANPPEAKFVWSDSRTLFSVSVQVICRDENQNELLNQKTECYYQNRNIVNAPEIEGYKPVGRTETEVEVLANRTSNPQQVVFDYKKDIKEIPSPVVSEPAECEVPVLCVLESGEEILNIKKTCRENISNIITAPDITGYVVTGNNSGRVRVSHDGTADPDKVVFTYKAIKKEIVPAKVTVICRDDLDNELRREYVEGKANETLNIKAPDIKGYKLVGGSGRVVEISVDDNGIPDQNEVVFVYKTVKERKRMSPVFSIMAALLLIAAGLLYFTRPVKTYHTITWKDDTGKTIDTTTVAYGEKPTHSVLPKAATKQYTYTFSGWQPAIQEVTGDTTYTATYKEEVRLYTIEWKDSTGKTVDTTMMAYGDKPTHSGFTKDATEQYLYTFAGWQPAIQYVTGDAVYVAVYRKETRSYTITWKDDAGKTIDTTNVAYGDKPTHSAITKASTKQYVYTFAGWQPDIKNVTGDATYVAVFNAKKKDNTVQTGDIVSFGHYEQDNNTENGREVIEWIVLDVDEKNNKALLLSKYGLRNKPYHTKDEEVTWEKCTLRSWLNDKFLDSVFTTKEQSAILRTKVENGSSQRYDNWNTKGGNNTKDKIFLLSYAEANRYLGVTYGNYTTKACVAPTAYAIAQGAWTSRSNKTTDGEPAGWWWLRSPGFYRDSAASVNGDGSLISNYVNYDYIVVRPALWINLESGIF